MSRCQSVMNIMIIVAHLPPSESRMHKSSNISKDKIKKFVWGPTPLEREYPSPAPTPVRRRLHLSALNHPTSTIFNKFTPMNSCDDVTYFWTLYSAVYVHLGISLCLSLFFVSVVGPPIKGVRVHKGASKPSYATAGWVTILTFQGHIASSITWPIDSPYLISYWCPIGIEPLAVF